jgi:hypothetical protein
MTTPGYGTFGSSSWDVSALSGGRVTKVVVNWTSSTGGKVDQTCSTPVYGTVMRVVTKSGTPTPTTLYSVSLKNDDVEAVGIATIDSSATVVNYPDELDGSGVGTKQITMAGLLQLSIASAGNSKKGQVTVYLTGGIV